MPRDQVFLVAVQRKSGEKRSYEDHLSELTSLTLSAGGAVVGNLKAVLERPTSNFFLTKGKLMELAGAVQATRANLTVFNVDLSPAQSRNIEDETGVRVVDRTGLILDIFARRAKSHAGRLQVEHAQLNYLLPRLVGRGVLMSRLGGGIGTRGPGEQKLEVDRRQIRNRIDKLKGELDKLKKHQELIRNHRKRKDFDTVALIGYTNAGKSTLLNTLTGSSVLVENRLFTTLDPTTRVFSLGRGRQILFTDTIGFLTDLPHALIEAFRSTLDEVTSADLLLHVLDISDPAYEDRAQSVHQVLQELNASRRPTVLALNKADLVSPEDRKRIAVCFPEGMFISARDRESLKILVGALEEKLRLLRTGAATGSDPVFN